MLPSPGSRSTRAWSRQSKRPSSDASQSPPLGFSRPSFSSLLGQRQEASALVVAGPGFWQLEVAVPAERFPSAFAEDGCDRVFNGTKNGSPASEFDAAEATLRSATKIRRP